MSPCGRRTLAEAQAALARREVFGILDIPAGTEREVLTGRQARLPAYVDSAYFLLYNRTLQGILEAHGAVTADLASRNARPDGSLYRAALAKSSPVEILNQPLFNPTGGYAQLHRAGRLHADPAADPADGVGDARRRRLRAGRPGRAPPPRRRRCGARPGPRAPPARACRGRRCSSSCCRASTASRPPSSCSICCALLIPFILSVSFLGQFVGTWFKRRETAVLLFIASACRSSSSSASPGRSKRSRRCCGRRASSFPARRRSTAWCASTRWARRLTDVFSDWMRLWVLTALYALLAVLAARIFVRERSSDGRAA